MTSPGQGQIRLPDGPEVASRRTPKGSKAAEASLIAMRAAYDNAAGDAERQSGSIARSGISRCASLRGGPGLKPRDSQNQVAAAEADVRRAIEAAG